MENLFIALKKSTAADLLRTRMSHVSIPEHNIDAFRKTSHWAVAGVNLELYFGWALQDIPEAANILPEDEVTLKQNPSNEEIYMFKIFNTQTRGYRTITGFPRSSPTGVKAALEVYNTNDERVGLFFMTKSGYIIGERYDEESGKWNILKVNKIE